MLWQRDTQVILAWLQPKEIKIMQTVGVATLPEVVQARQF